MASHLEQHLRWMRLCGRSERTLVARRSVLVRLAEWLGTDPAHATYEQLARWQLHLHATISLDAVAWHTSVARPYYRWLQAHGHRQDNPAALLPVPPRRRGLPRPMAERDVMRMLHDAPARLLPWLLLAGWSGLRACEIAPLQVDDFFADPAGRRWVRLLGKGDVERNVPIPDWAWQIIAARLPASGPCWRRERGHGPVTAHHVSGRCNDYLHGLGIPDTLHSLRHRVATMVLEQTGGDLRLVQELLGHSSPTTTAIYTLVAPRRVAAAVDAVPGPAACMGSSERVG
jgi:site-specific recombinase XerD